MDIKELDKKQIILLTLLITFVVSMATGIITVSLMNQMPKSVPQTINNVIQRTIEKVTTVEVPVYQDKEENNTINNKNEVMIPLNENEALVPIYLNDKDLNIKDKADEVGGIENKIESIGEGVIISDIGLVLVDSNLIKDLESYKILLNKTEFGLVPLKKFNNGFTVMKIIPFELKNIDKTETPPELQEENI